MSDALPHGWATTSLGALCDDKVTQGPPTAEPVPYIDISSIDRSTKRVGETTLISGTDAPTRARQWVRKDDVLVSMTRPNLNAVAQVGAEIDGAVASTGFDVLRPRAVDSRWIFYRVRTHEFVADVCKGLQGVVYPAIRPHDVRRHELPLPPVPEQHRIVSVLESYFTRLDDAVATLERVQRNLKRYRASVLKAAVEGRLVPTEAELARAEGRSYEPASVLLTRILAERRSRWEEAERAKLTTRGKAPKDDKWKAKYKEPAPPDTSELAELPEGWCWATIPYLHAQDGFVSDGDWVESEDQDPEGTIRLTQLQDVGDGVFRDRSRRFMNEEQVARLRCTYLKPSDILIARMPDPLGRACIFPGLASPAVTAVDVCIVRLGSDACDSQWLVHVLNAPLTRASIAELQSGSTRKRISRANLCTVALPVPPFAEQGRIRIEVDRLLSVIEDCQAALVAQLLRIVRLRQSILKLAFEGRLVDQDPRDEPASVLLERIRAERASTASTPPRRPRRTKARIKKS